MIGSRFGTFTWEVAMKRLTLTLVLALVGLTLLGGGCDVTENEPCRVAHYLDDMEEIELVDAFPVMRENWVPASAPLEYRWQDNRRINWYVKDREVKEEDLFPSAESKPGESYIPVMEIKYRGPMYEDQGFDTSREWVGLMRLIFKTGADYSDFRFFEIWLRQKRGVPGGRLNVDLGKISEDFYRPGDGRVLHTEDVDLDGELGQEENTGLDGVFTGQEGDDPYDDWAYSEGDYSRINGTEGNPGTVPDTEDLDGDAILDTDDIHFRLSFDLDDTTHMVNRTEKGWTQYRIPLTDAITLGGLPSWQSIRYMRFFFAEADTEAVYQIAYLEVTGSTWADEGIRWKSDMAPTDPLPDETFWLSAKNTRDDPDYFPPYDPGNDSQGYTRREQSMVLAFRNLDPGHCGAVHKDLSPAEDITLYESLGFYVCGSEGASAGGVYMFVRLGRDDLNFFEYATGLESGWKAVEVGFDQLLALQEIAAERRVIYGSEVDFRAVNTADGWVAMYGEPSLGEISWIGAGVTNAGSSPTGTKVIEAWFDDFRAIAVR